MLDLTISSYRMPFRWIVLLIVVFNYILGCMCMLFLKKNDPYHFGSISRAMVIICLFKNLEGFICTERYSTQVCSSPMYWLF
jgi:hypothetical protein